MATRKAKARIAPFVPSKVSFNPRDVINQVLNDATWTVVTPDWAKWVQTKDDGTWESLPAKVTAPVIAGAAAKKSATKKRATKRATKKS